MLITVAFSIVGVVGDYFLKLASTHANPLKSGVFYVGFALYASTAFGWVYVMKYLKLGTIGVLLLRMHGPAVDGHRGRGIQRIAQL